jgi:hypothetical protein
MRVEYKKAPDWPREVRYAARSGAEVTKLGVGGNQARMNKQYSGQTWRPPWPKLKQQDREAGLAQHFVYDPDKKTNHLRSLLGFETVPFRDAEFAVRVSMDGTPALRNGHIEVRTLRGFHCARHRSL